jgi:hypothetical protein
MPAAENHLVPEPSSPRRIGNLQDPQRGHHMEDKLLSIALLIIIYVFTALAYKKGW